MILWLRPDVVLQESEVTGVEVEEEVPVGTKQSPAVQGSPETAARVCECLLDMVKRLKHVEYLRMLVKQLACKGGATAGLCKKKDVLPNSATLRRCRAVIAGKFPSVIWIQIMKKSQIL